MTEGTEHFRKHIGRWNGGCPKFNNLFVRADKFIENMIPDFQHGDCRIIEIISLRGDVQFLCGAGNELGIQFLFKGSHMGADCWLGQKKMAGGFRKAIIINNGHKGL